MKKYKHILLPIDFSKSSLNTVLQGMNMAKDSQAKVTLVNFVEPIPASAYTSDTLELEEEIHEAAQQKMSQIAKQYNLPINNTRIETAHAKTYISQYAEEIGADLIIIGSHGHHGALSHLLGSTASAVANRAKCDVFIVRDND